MKRAYYDKNRDPLVTPATTKTPLKQGEQNLAPTTNPVSSKPTYGEEVMPRNKVTAGSSARLQKAGRLPGRVSDGTKHRTLSS